MPCSARHTRRPMMSPCLTTDDGNSGHLVTAVNARFLHCNIISFPFVHFSCGEDSETT